MNRIISSLLIMCCLFSLGCRRGVADFTTEDVKRISAIKEQIAKACGFERGSEPIESGIRMFRELVATTNAIERKKWLTVVCDAMSTTKFSGSNISERQVSYAHLHYFREKASELLGVNVDDLRWQLELWFAEAECFRKESAYCRSMANEIEAVIKKGTPTKMELPSDFSAKTSLLCEWETCARHSAEYHAHNMAMIVLWDDSVAARYCATLPWWRKKLVVWRIKKVIGRYPDWYLEEKKKGAK